MASKYLKKKKVSVIYTLIFKYEKLQQRQKHLEHKVNQKISNDIYNVQQTLDTLTRHSLKTDNIEYGNGLLENNKEEEYQQSSMDIVNIDARNTRTINHKNRTDWYASLLMYNSY